MNINTSNKNICLKLLEVGNLKIFEVLVEFWRGLEDPRNDKIYSSGNPGVKKSLGPEYHLKDHNLFSACDSHNRIIKR